MFQTNPMKRVLLLCITFFTVIFYVIIFSHTKAFAARVDYYSYDNVYKNLPKAYRSSEYIYISDDIPCICFPPIMETIMALP